MGTYSLDDKAYFNEFAGGYSPYSERDLESMMATFANLRINRRGEKIRICEIGCASGQFSQMLASRSIYQRGSFYGLDIALQVLSLYPYEKICGSAFLSPFKRGSFDMICLPATLHHLFPLEDSLAELNRILASGGYFFCMEPNLLHPHRYFFMRWRFLYRLRRRANDVPIHPEKLMDLLSQFGFYDVRINYLNLYFASPSCLQKMQNHLADHVSASSLKKYLMPWFILVARKK